MERNQGEGKKREKKNSDAKAQNIHGRGELVIHHLQWKEEGDVSEEFGLRGTSHI